MSLTGVFYGGPLDGQRRGVKEEADFIQVASLAPEVPACFHADSPTEPVTLDIRTYRRVFMSGGVAYYAFVDPPVTESPSPKKTAPRGSQCLSVEPGVIDFPGRCRRVIGHDGPHASFANPYEGGTEWEDHE